MTNNVSVLFLICLLALVVGVVHLIAAADVLGHSGMSWWSIESPFFCLASWVGAALVLPAVAVSFSRRLAWLLLIVTVALATIGWLIVTLTWQSRLEAWSMFALTSLFSMTTLILLLNRKVVEEATNR